MACYGGAIGRNSLFIWWNFGFPPSAIDKTVIKIYKLSLFFLLLKSQPEFLGNLCAATSRHRN